MTKTINYLPNAPVVLHHANCLDGTGAKYAAWTKFQDNATYIPVQYGQPAPIIPDGHDVFILDFSYDRDTLEAIKQRSKSLLVLDHHKSAEIALQGLEYAKFDMQKSGAVLAWEHFQPGKEIPDLLKAVQDRDLWKFELPYTKEITAYLPILNGGMREWGEVATDSTLFNHAANAGWNKLKFDKLEIDSFLKSVIVVDYAGHRCGFCNTNTLISEKGNAICEQMPVDFSLTYFVDMKGTATLSFRSKPGGFNVRSLAEELGGGGHNNAAGASHVPLKFIQQLYRKRIA